MKSYLAKSRLVPLVLIFGMILLIDLAVGLVVACTVYGFYALFSRGEI